MRVVNACTRSRPAMAQACSGRLAATVCRADCRVRIRRHGPARFARRFRDQRRSDSHGRRKDHRKRHGRFSQRTDHRSGENVKIPADARVIDGSGMTCLSGPHRRLHQSGARGARAGSGPAGGGGGGQTSGDCRCRGRRAAFTGSAPRRSFACGSRSSETGHFV